MRFPAGLFVFALIVVATLWWWMGLPVRVPPTDAPAVKAACLSYAPFRGDQSPFTPGIRIERTQIEQDLARLAEVTECVRTYSVDQGLDQVPPIAERLGLKVILGSWLSRNRVTNRTEIDRTIALARRYPHVVTAVVVGNEVLLRGELSADDLGAIIREVRAAVPVPVTYADVWEYWLRNRDLAAATDFVTIHILPYWEDEPVAAHEAGAHVDSISDEVAASFPGREILIGEVGWPSHGRMRQGALPSPSNQARVVADVIAGAARHGYRINLIEAFDQPWKRALEGTVGGYWGLFTSDGREPKFVFGKTVSNHPWWRWQLLGGLVFVCCVFAAAWIAAGRAAAKMPALSWLAVGANAIVGGVLAGWTIETILIESLGPGGAVRGTALGLAALASPIVGAGLLARGAGAPTFAQTLGATDERPADPLVVVAGALLVLLTLVAIETALGLVFNSRYRDLPFAALTAAVFPFLVLRLNQSQKIGCRGVAETVAAAILALSAAYIVFNEGIANWQALWLAGGLVALAITLVRGRDAQSS